MLFDTNNSIILYNIISYDREYRNSVLVAAHSCQIFDNSQPQVCGDQQLSRTIFGQSQLQPLELELAAFFKDLRMRRCILNIQLPSPGINNEKKVHILIINNDSAFCVCLSIIIHIKLFFFSCIYDSSSKAQCFNKYGILGSIYNKCINIDV